ncbi:MAG: bifunctional methylenetetrahydrofolate dehydrogenase/methenyltetrahydrofolate cyclohydrolase [Clostridia bacterium]|nr:bifunctional methylenetetrahydrofolate dehydrogenase/methenyltetrahydrofolate cyclohydrolase [Clostridia bacterium]
MSIVNVRDIVENKKQTLKRKIVELRDEGIIPKLAVILANDNDASRIYVGRKRKLCHEMGIDEVEYVFDEKCTTEELLYTIEKLNNDNDIDGILVQLPMFSNIDEQKVLDAVAPEKDVDGFSSINVGRLYKGSKDIVPCTPKGIVTILKELEPDLAGKNAVVVGRSQIVGKPMAALLLAEDMTVTICHSKTKDLVSHTKMADVLVVATGIPHLIKKDMVKENAIVIDVGMTKVKDKLVGDVDTENVKDIAKYVTPVPGGVGLTTVFSLMENVVNLAIARRKK